MGTIEPGVTSQITNLGYLFREQNGVTQLCIGEIIKEGFSKGFLNGFGGKVGDKVIGESVEEALVREAKEEFRITLREFMKKAVINFYSKSLEIPDVTCHVYFVKSYDGIPTIGEDKELVPYWFDIDKLPYEKMWPSDRHWLRDLLRINNQNYLGNSDYCIYDVLSSLDWKTILSIKRFDKEHNNPEELKI